MPLLYNEAAICSGAEVKLENCICGSRDEGRRHLMLVRNLLRATSDNSHPNDHEEYCDLHLLVYIHILPIRI